MLGQFGALLVSSPFCCFCCENYIRKWLLFLLCLLSYGMWDDSQRRRNCGRAGPIKPLGSYLVLTKYGFWTFQIRPWLLLPPLEQMCPPLVSPQLVWKLNVAACRCLLFPPSLFLPCLHSIVRLLRASEARPTPSTKPRLFVLDLGGSFLLRWP